MEAHTITIVIIGIFIYLAVSLKRKVIRRKKSEEKCFHNDNKKYIYNILHQIHGNKKYEIGDITTCYNDKEYDTDNMYTCSDVLYYKTVVQCNGYEYEFQAYSLDNFVIIYKGVNYDITLSMIVTEGAVLKKIGIY